MAIKNILVAYSGSDSSKSALKLARLMMEKYDAHLTGALTHAPSEISVTLKPYASAEVTGIIAKAEADRCSAISQEFFDELGPNVTKNIHWSEAGGDVDYSLAEMARTYDLVVMGQYDGTRENRNVVPHPDMIALNSGRPVIVVPKELDKNVLNEKALLAWDGGRSAARALADAIDILTTKSDITILTIGTSNAETLQKLEGVTRQLDRHGINSDIEIMPRSHRTIAKTLLATVDQLGAGLLVMGAYQHSKFSEDIWGGVTNSILKNAKVPVLLSH